jgi:dynein heavy chain
MRGREDDPRTLLFFQVTVAASEHGDDVDEDERERERDNDDKGKEDGNSNTNAISSSRKSESKTREKMVFTTGSTDGLCGICVYFLALPVVGKPDPTLGFLGSFRIVSGQFNAKSGPSLLSDMSDLIGIVYGPIYSLEQHQFGHVSPPSRYPSAIGAGAINASIFRGAVDSDDGRISMLNMHTNLNNTKGSQTNTTIQEFSSLMKTTSASMAHVGRVSKLTSAIEAANLSETSPDRLLRQLNRLLSRMLQVSIDDDNEETGSSKGNNEASEINKNGQSIDNDRYSGYDSNAELLRWKVTMVRLASAQQQAEEPVFLELLKAVKNQMLVKEWNQQLGELRHKLAEAKDNVKYLYAIAEVTRPLITEHPKSLVETMPRIVNSIAWMACISRFFNTPDRLASLFHRLSERVVRSCKKCIYNTWLKVENRSTLNENNLKGTSTIDDSNNSNRKINNGSASKKKKQAVDNHWDDSIRIQLIESIESCIEFCEAFRSSYTETRVGLKRFPNAPQFDFNETFIFGPLNDFQTRAEVLREMLQTLLELSTIGKRGSQIRDETQQVLRRVSLLERKYAVEKFDPLDVKKVRGGPNLIHLINAFRSFVLELVSNVKQAIETRLRECTSTKQALKFLAGILSVDGLMAQPGMHNSVQNYYSSVVKRYRVELDRIAKLYETQKRDPPLRRSIPPVAGHIEWSRQLFRRISEPMLLIEKHDQKNRRENKEASGEGEGVGVGVGVRYDRLAESADVDPGYLDSGDSLADDDDVPIRKKLKMLSNDLVKSYNRIAKTLVKYEALWHKEWESSVDGFEDHLHRPLLIRETLAGLDQFYIKKQEVEQKVKTDQSSATQRNSGKNNDDYDEDLDEIKLGVHGIRVNFDARLFQLTNEARHMVRLGYAVPESARFVCEQESRLKRTYEELKFLLCELHDSMVRIPEEVRPLLVPLLKRIDNVLLPGLHTINNIATDVKTGNTTSTVNISTLTWMSLQVPTYIFRVEQAVRDLQGRVAKTRDVLEHQITPGITHIREYGGSDFLTLPRGLHAAQLSVAGFLEHVEARCHHISKKIEERSASIEGAVEHMIGRACENYSSDELAVVLSSANKLRTHYESLIQDAVENVVITTLRALRLRVASGVGGCFLFLDPPLFRVEAQLKIPEVILSPPLDTIQLCINKAAKAIIFSTREVYRWTARRNQAITLNLSSLSDTTKNITDESEKQEVVSTLAERNSVAPPLSDKHSFFIEIAKKRGLVKVVLQMTASLSRLHNRVDDHLQCFEQFGFLWRKMANEQLAGFINEPSDERYSLTLDVKVEPTAEDAYVRHYASQRSPTMVDEFARELKLLNTVLERIEVIKPVKIIESLAVDCTSLKTSLQAEAQRWKQLYGTALAEWALDEIRSLQGFLSETRLSLEHEVTNLDELSIMMNTLNALRELESEIDEKIQPILEAQKMLDRFQIDVSVQHVDMVLALQDEWQKLKQLAEDCADRLQQLQPIFRRQLNDDVSAFKVDVSEFCTSWADRGPSSVDAENPRIVRMRLEEFSLSFATRQHKFERFAAGEVMFGQPVTTFPDLEAIEVQIEQLTLLLALHQDVSSTIDRYENQQWYATNFRELQETIQSLRKRWHSIPVAAHIHKNVCNPIKNLLETFSQKLAIVLRLAKPSMMMRRHWEMLEEILDVNLFNRSKEKFRYQQPPTSGGRLESWKLGEITKASILEHREDILSLCASASKEGGVRRKLDKIKADWTFAELAFTSYKSTSHKGQVVLENRATHALMVRLEDSVVALSALAASRHTSPFRAELLHWLQTLGTVRETLEHWLEVQALWMYLEAVFSGGDIALSMPLEAKRFAALDKTWVTAVLSAVSQPDVITVCCTNDNIRNALPYLSEQFERSQKSLSGYLAQKRDQFPRFYFLSDPVLLEILGRGSEPISIQPHIHRLFASVKEIVFLKDAEGSPSDKISGLVSETGENLLFVGDRTVRTSNHIERWLSWFEAEIRHMICSNIYDAVVEVAGGEDDTDEDEAEMEDFSALGIGNARGGSNAIGSTNQRLDSRKGPLSNKIDILKLFKSSSTQSCLTAVHVSWTNQCTEVIHMLMNPYQYAAKVEKDKKDSSNTKKEKGRSTTKESLAIVLQRTSMSLKVMVAQAADPSFPCLYRKKLQAVITLQIHLRDSTDNLYRLRIKSVNDFDWQRQIKMYWMPDNYGTLEEIADEIASRQHAHRNGGSSGSRRGMQMDVAKRLEGVAKKSGGSLENKTTSCCVTRILMTEESYGFEYLGSCTRLVMTPLTERCYITLSQALSLYLGAAPTGPAGTGKTETVKDMAKAMGRLVYVFNCSSQMNVHALGQIFKGLAQCGAWGDFDEFNRIDLSVLSVAAQQISIIFEALRAKKSAIVFVDGKRCSVNRNCGLFITMNPPQYGGRTSLPENLKAQFRSVSMIKPNRESIIRVILSSAGFQLADVLASRLHVLYGLCKQQLSNQPHYDFGLRSILSILETAGKSLRNSLAKLADESEGGELIKTSAALENGVFVDTIRDLNVPRLTAEDVPLFVGLLSDLWANLDNVNSEQESTEKDLIDHLEESATEQLFDPTPSFLEKIIQLYNVLDVRVGVALLGGSMSGKTAATRVLLQTLSERSDDIVYRESRMNPKSVGQDRIFGNLNPVTFDWTDGVLTRLWRRAIQRQKTQHEHTWLVIDGPVDPEWIEDLNSVLDDNRVLTLANSDRLAIPSGTKLLFEVEDLRHASPATVSRLGIVNMGDDRDGKDVVSTVPWKSLFKSWVHDCKMQRAEIQAGDADSSNNSIGVRGGGDGETSEGEVKIIKNGYRNGSSSSAGTVDQVSDSTTTLLEDVTQKNIEKLEHLVNQHMEASLIFVTSTCTPLAPLRWVPLVRNFLRLLDSVAESCELDLLADWTSAREIDRCFVYALAWSMGSLLSEEDCKMFDEFLRARYDDTEKESTVLQVLPGSVYDTIYKYDLRADRVSSCSWVHYEEIAMTEQSRYDQTSNLMIVPTLQHICCRDQYVRFSKSGLSVVLIGSSACGKSTILADGIDSRRTSAEMEEVGHGQATVSALSSFRVSLTGPHNAEQLQTILERELEKKMAQLYGPRRSKRLIYVLQDLNIPEPDKWGAQPVLELVSQISHEQGVYSITKAGEWHSFDSLELTGTMVLNSERPFDNIGSRILGRMVLLHVETPTEANLQAIFSHILLGQLEEQKKTKFNDLVENIVQMTIFLLSWSSKRFFNTPLQPWLVFTARDAASIFQGLNKSQKGGFPASQAEMMSIWRHECERVIMDKLSIPMDREEFSAEIVKQIQKYDNTYVSSSHGKNSSNSSRGSPKANKKERILDAGTFAAAIAGSSKYYRMPMLGHGINDTLTIGSSESGEEFMEYSVVENIDDVRFLLEQLIESSKKMSINEADLKGSEISSENAVQFMMSTLSKLNISLFSDVIFHCLRVSRALANDGTHAIIVGISGTGKQSIARLACVASGYVVVKLPERGQQIVKSTDIAAYHSMIMELLRNTWKTAVLSNTPVALLLKGDDCVLPNMNGDSMILEYVNCLLADGMIPGMFTTDELEALRLEMAASMAHATNAINESFKRLRRNLRVVMCLNSRSLLLQKYFVSYPQLLRRCYIDVVDSWSRDALRLVATERLKTVNFASNSTSKFSSSNSPETRKGRRKSLREKKLNETRDLIVSTLSTFHVKASSSSDYMGLVTPRSFLALLDTFKQVFETTDSSRNAQIKKLEKGQAKLAEAERGTEIMGHELKEQQLELEAKGLELALLLDRIRADTTMAERKKGEVEAVRRRLGSEARDLADKVSHIEAELADALPVLEEALSALDAITSGDISNLRTMRQPPMLIKRIMDAVLIIQKFPLPPQEVLYEMDAQRKNFVEGAEMMPCWNEAKTMMADGSKFLRTLTDFNPALLNEESVDLLEPYLNRADFTYTAAKRSSGNIAGVCTWVRSLVNYFHVAKVVLPLKASAEMEQKRLEDKKVMLKKAEAELEEKKADLKKITAEYDDAMRSMQELETSLEHTKNNIDAARSLVASLEGEKIRWAEQHREITIRLGQTPCESAIAASFLIYAGALNPFQRLGMMTSWLKEVRWAELPDLVDIGWIEKIEDNNESNKINEQTMQIGSSPVMRGLMKIIGRLLLPDNLEQRWVLHGLPADEHSLQNAIVVQNSIAERIPLLLDPQGQGSRWLQNTLKAAKSFVALTQDDPNLNILIENALSEGTSMVIYNVRPSEFPLIIRSLIARKIVYNEEENREMILINDEEYDFDPKFRLYLIRDIESVEGFSNEMLGDIVAINFGITPHALEDQLLEVVASFELRDLQRQRRSLLEDLGRDRERLVGLADTLLASLSKAQGNLIEDSELIRVLKDTHQTVEQTSAKIESSMQTQINLHRSRENYRKVAKRGSTIFFAIAEMKSQNHVYQLSLSRFMEYYERAIRQAEPSEDTPKRVKRIIESVMSVICESVYTMMYGKDRITFGLLLSLRVMLDMEHITHRHLRAMLDTPKTLSKRHPDIPKASAEWLTPHLWNQLCAFRALVPEFDVIYDQLHAAHHTEAWRDWKDSIRPEKLKPPISLGETGLFVLIRIWRPDRLIAMTNAIIERELKITGNLNSIDMTKRDASMSRPTIYLLSRGADPARDISDLAHRERVEFHIFSMGQGQENQALSMLKKCAFEGTWLMLQNCHLNVDFMGELDRLLRTSSKASVVGEMKTVEAETIGKSNVGGGSSSSSSSYSSSRKGSSSGNSSKTGVNDKRAVSLVSAQSESLVTHSSFRLWLTILPVSTFPEALLKLSVVVSSEPPNGLRSGLLGCYSKDGPAAEFFHDVGHDQWKNFLFALCFLHITVCQRREYGNFGWTFPYAFGKADLSASLMYSRTLFDSSDTNTSVDWISVRFVVCEILYGGLITTDSDRKVVQALGRNLLDNRIFNSGHQIAPGLAMPDIKNNQSMGQSVSRGYRGRENASNSTKEEEGATLDDFVSYADNLASDDRPEWFGLHSNAAFMTLQSSGYELLRNTWRCFSELEVAESETGVSEFAVDPEKELKGVQQICTQIRKMVNNFSTITEIPKQKHSYMAPLNFVLRQEHAALVYIYKILEGDVNGVLECIKTYPSTVSSASSSLLNSIKYGLPKSWVNLVPQVGAYEGMSIGPWLQNIQKRHIQIQAWYNVENHLASIQNKERRSSNNISSITHRLESYNLGLFFNPQGFLVALRQEVVRLKRVQGTKLPWSVEDTRLRSILVRLNNGEKLELPKLGTNLYGLTMEGAAWDGHSLIEQEPQEVVTAMPVVALSIVHVRAMQFDGRSYNCPVYRCSGNRDAPAKAFDISLPTDINSDHWCLRGCALFLSRKLE